MPQQLTLAVSQSHTLSSTSETLQALAHIAHQAAQSGAHLLLLPETYLGGYPRTCTFGASVGTSSDHGRDQFLQYFRDAIDLGDTPGGEGEDWVERTLPVASGKDFRGDGTREKLEEIAKETGVFLIVGLVERAGGSMYCAVVYVCPRKGCVGKRRKVMPTSSERLIWAQGSPSTLRAITTVINGVKLTLAAAICSENYMPLLRFSLYSQNINLYLAPTADERHTWLPLLQTIAVEGRAFVLSANQCLRRKHLPKWITQQEESNNRQLKSAIATTPTLRKTRRSSFVTKTEDDHEITWPLTGTKLPDVADEEHLEDIENTVEDEGSSPEGRCSKTASEKTITTKIQNNHEIKWPSPHPQSNPRNEDTSDILNTAATSSPIRVDTVAIDENTSRVEKMKPKSPGALRRPSIPTKVPESYFIALPSNVSPVKSSEEKTCLHTTFEVPSDIPQPTVNQATKADEEFVSRGGSCIISPTGSVLAGPLWEVENGLLFATVDFEDCERGRLDMDVAGSSGRLDAFDLRVRGLDINPPPW